MTKTLTLSVWGREFTLPIEYDCYKGEKVTKEQIAAIKGFAEHNDWVEASKSKVEEFCKERVLEDDENQKIFVGRPAWIFVFCSDAAGPFHPADEAKEDGLGNDHGCTDFKSPAGTGRDNTYRTGGPKFIPAGPGGCLFHPFVEQKRFLLSGL